MTLHDISINIVGGYGVVAYATSHPSYHGWKLLCLKYVIRLPLLLCFSPNT